MGIGWMGWVGGGAGSRVVSGEIGSRDFPGV